MKNKVIAIKVLSTKGLKGEVKLKSFMDDTLFLLTCDLYDCNENIYQIERISGYTGAIVAKFVGIDDVDSAKKLNGLELSINRDIMPSLKDDNFYYVDLEGLDVLNENHHKIGKVVAIHNFGAGDILEIKKNDDGQPIMINFSHSFVTEVNVAGGYVVVSVNEIFDKDLVKEDE